MSFHPRQGGWHPTRPLPFHKRSKGLPNNPDGNLRNVLIIGGALLAFAGCALANDLYTRFNKEEERSSDCNPNIPRHSEYSEGTIQRSIIGSHSTVRVTATVGNPKVNVVIVDDKKNTITGDPYNLEGGPYVVSLLGDTGISKMQTTQTMTVTQKVLPDGKTVLVYEYNCSRQKETGRNNSELIYELAQKMHPGYNETSLQPYSAERFTKGLRKGPARRRIEDRI